MSLEWRIVPIEKWPGEPTRHRNRSRFDSTWTQTTTLLERELELLRARDLLLQLAVTRDEIRLDGWIRANAYPSAPGVILTFHSRKLDKTLSYPCDAFTDWQANVRAIALGLEALRKVERYGITQRGEQYTGWAQLPPPGGSTSTMTARFAARVLATRMGMSGEAQERRIMESPEAFKDSYRQAAKRTHPDTGGSDEEFQLVNGAKEVLEKHHSNGRFGGE